MLYSPFTEGKVYLAGHGSIKRDGVDRKATPLRNTRNLARRAELTVRRNPPARAPGRVTPVWHPAA